MKTLFEKFEDAEYKKLRDVKIKTGLTWHDFILTLAKNEVMGSEGSIGEV